MTAVFFAAVEELLSAGNAHTKLLESISGAAECQGKAAGRNTALQQSALKAEESSSAAAEENEDDCIEAPAVADANASASRQSSTALHQAGDQPSPNVDFLGMALHQGADTTKSLAKAARQRHQWQGSQAPQDVLLLTADQQLRQGIESSAEAKLVSGGHKPGCADAMCSPLQPAPSQQCQHNQGSILDSANCRASLANQCCLSHSAQQTAGNGQQHMLPSDQGQHLSLCSRAVDDMLDCGKLDTHLQQGQQQSEASQLPTGDTAPRHQLQTPDLSPVMQPARSSDKQVALQDTHQEELLWQKLQASLAEEQSAIKLAQLTVILLARM